MPGSGTRTFLEPDHYEASLRQAQIEFVITCGAGFKARQIWAELHQLQLLRCEEDLPRGAAGRSLVQPLAEAMKHDIPGSPGYTAQSLARARRARCSEPQSRDSLPGNFSRNCIASGKVRDLGWRSAQVSPSRTRFGNPANVGSSVFHSRRQAWPRQ